jgi:hypothetical protein
MPTASELATTEAGQSTATTKVSRIGSDELSRDRRISNAKF